MAHDFNQVVHGRCIVGVKKSMVVQAPDRGPNLLAPTFAGRDLKVAWGR
ncbi:hypothetical protein [Bosea sp. NBC_00550]|nr:hypothetical protein [Bosea sp. NBC_00550]UZF95827.1 hypothetical protein NWE53_28040 [Bosea sp. NBC_00550]